MAYGRFFMSVEELDRILQRNDVDFLGLIQLVDHGRESCRLSGARSAGDENDPVLFLHHLAKNRGETELFEGRNFGLELAHDNGVPAILLENIHSETSHILDGVAAIAGACGRELRPETLASVHHLSG